MSLSRRGFLGWASALGAGAAVGKAGKASAGGHPHFEGYADRYGMLTDVTRCVGCRSCEAACNEVNELPEPEEPFDDLGVLEHKRRTSEEAHTVVNRFERGEGQPPAFLKTQCNHCNEPACASACFVGAFTKTPEGPVVYDHKVCLGCKYCIVACPFNIPAYKHHDPLTPRVMKCTLCFDRIAEGQMPACAAACPKEAILFGRRDELIQVAWERIRRHEGRYQEHLYGEHEVGGTSWLYLSDVPFEDLGMRMDLGVAPLAERTSGFLEAVPAVFTLWPGLLAGFYLMTRRQSEVEHREREDAVAGAIEATQTEEQGKAASSAESAKRRAEFDKEKAVKAAVKEALAEAEKGKEESP